MRTSFYSNMSTEESNVASPLPPPPVNNAPIGPGNHARAWNDPPMFSTEVNVAARPPANKLNKRVAHPISSQSVISQVTASPAGAVPPIGFNSQMPSLMTPSSSEAQVSFYSPEQ